MSRRSFRLARTAAVLAGAAIIAALWLSAGGSRAPTAPTRARSTSSPPARSARVPTKPAATVTASDGAVNRTTVGLGALPQTDAEPVSDDPQFLAEMDGLWQAIVGDSSTPALSAFFPVAAYLQLKTIAGAGDDYQDRLVHDYALDIAAAHALLGPGAPGATLVGVNVPSQDAHWVQPGVCDNDVGYFEVPNSRLVYQEDGQIRSTGIASMISWRGEWYVVHLGAILRSSDRGMVDDPVIGPGTSAPSSTC